jgi:hypothetical protein
MISDDDICTSCKKAEVFEDLGLSEEVYFHCYKSNCKCGCYKKAQEAAQTMREYWFQEQRAERAKRVNKK